MVAKHPGKVKFVSENFGASKLAERFGIDRYPAVFVDDVLVAKPRDFGFFAVGDQPGRYTPWRNEQSQARFKADLERMIELVLAGKKKNIEQERASTPEEPVTQIASLPKFTAADLEGNSLTSDQFNGKVVLVEFWATWCPPCQSTLKWLGELKKKYGADIEVIAFAVESPEDKVRKTVGDLGVGLHWAISDAATAAAFGDVTAVPTMFLFDKNGKAMKVIYGAPPDLHSQAEKLLNSLIR